MVAGLGKLSEGHTDEVVIATSRTEFAGLANAIGEALHAVDDWEFGTRVGVPPAEARTLRDQIGEKLRSSFRPD